LSPEALRARWRPATPTAAVSSDFLDQSRSELIEDNRAQASDFATCSSEHVSGWRDEIRTVE